MKSRVIKRSREEVSEVVNRFNQVFEIDRRQNSYIMINDIPHRFNEKKELIPFQKV